MNASFRSTRTAYRHAMSFAGCACAVLLCSALFAPAPATAADRASSVVTGKGLLELEGTKATVADMQQKFQLYTAEYKRRLTQARPKAVSDADVDEVKRIDQALEGGFVDGFTSKGAQEARKFYDEKLDILVKELLTSLNRDVKTLLTSGKTDDAALVKNVVDFLSAYADKSGTKADGKSQASFVVEADKDWQSTGVTLKGGARVWIEAQGRWAPGSPGKNRIDLADADTFNLQLRITGREGVINVGTKGDVVTETGGEISARMVPMHRGARSEARGKLNVRLQWKEIETSKSPGQAPLEKVLADLTASSQAAPTAGAPGAPATPATPAAGTAGAATVPAAAAQPQTSSVILRATDDIIKTGIRVSSGDRITIDAIGEWTPNKDKTPPSSADVHNFVLHIDRTLMGRFGKRVDAFANATGEICLRPTFTKWAKDRDYTPSGSLKITITVTPGTGPAPAAPSPVTPQATGEKK